MMNFNFLNLDQKTREIMVNEIESDIDKGELYISKRLTTEGKKLYPSFLLESASKYNEERLESLLDINTYFESECLNGARLTKMPKNASKLLSQCEFNKYYIRSICIRALESDDLDVEIYRAKNSSRSRPESEAKIGKKINAKDLLDSLRNPIRKEVKLLPDINSGLSVKLVQNNLVAT